MQEAVEEEVDPLLLLESCLIHLEARHHRVPLHFLEIVQLFTPESVLIYQMLLVLGLVLV